MNNEIAASVTRCIEKLDSILPETAYVPWRERVNLETLDMSNYNTDIIAQVFGYADDWHADDWAGWAAYLIDIEDPEESHLIDHGLDVPTANPTPGVAVWLTIRERHAALTAAWVAAITNSSK